MRLGGVDIRPYASVGVTVQTAEEFGADRGSVVDLFLPGAVARKIPLVAGSSAVLAVVLNLRALRRR